MRIVLQKYAMHELLVPRSWFNLIYAIFMLLMIITGARLLWDGNYILAVIPFLIAAIMIFHNLKKERKKYRVVSQK